MARPIRHLLLSLALLGAGCDAGTNVIGPENQLEVTNAPDNFQWQVTALSKVTQTLTYTWAHTGTTANVNQSSSLSGGSADLRVLDATGKEVYSSSLATNGTSQTAAGTAGNWTIRVSLAKAGGTLNFRVQKR